jgi:ribosomal protein S6
MIDGDRTSGSDRSADYLVTMEEKSRQLTEEMQRVAREDEQLLRDLVRLDELRQLQANERQQRRKR